MSDENRQLGDADLGETAERAREIGDRARDDEARRSAAAASPPAANDVTREVYADTTDAIARSQRIRAADDARTDERQEELARMEADAAAQLRENAEALRQTAQDLAETRERMRRIAADTKELAADVRATREDTSRVGEAVRTTPPVVDPPVGGE